MAESDTRPRLLVIIGTLIHMGGAERQALHLLEHLAGIGANVEVLAFEDGQALRPFLARLGVPVHVFPYYFRWPRARRAIALARLSMMIRKLKPDALLPFVGVHSKTAAQVFPFSGAKFCWWNQQDEGRDLGGTRAEKTALLRVSRITSNSTAGRDFLAATYSIDPASILVYNNGTPVPDQTSEGDIRDRLGLGDARIVSMIANITSFKDHGTLVDAWALVREKLGSADTPTLVLAGHMREEQTAERLKLQAFDHGFSSEEIRFAGPLTDVAELMCASDLVVHSSLTEGCPNSVCEAMALGRAVVATDIPGCRQALGDESEACLAPPRDPKGLADRIVMMLRDDALREREGQKNRTRIVSEFSLTQMNRFFQDVIEHGLGTSIA